MSTWVAGITDRVSGPASTMKSALVGLGQGASSVAKSISSMELTSTRGSASLRSMYSEVDKAKARLARLQATKSTLESSGSIDIKVGQKLSKDIDATKEKITSITSAIAKGGGAAFDTKAFDAKTASAAASLGKIAGIAAKVTLTALATIPGAAVAGLYAIGRKALDGQYQAQARLNAVQARFNLGLRDIAKNANLTPFLNALDRGAAMFDKNSATGRFMGEQVKRAFDVAGRAVTALTPYAEKAFAKLLIGTIKAETAFWKLLIAGTKVGIGIATWLGSSQEKLDAVSTAGNVVGTTFRAIGTALEVVRGALGGGAMFAIAAVGLGLMAAKAAGAVSSVIRLGVAFTASNPGLVAAAAAILAVAAAYKQAIELKNQWDENSGEQIKKRFSEVGLFGEEKNPVGAMKTQLGTKIEAMAAPAPVTEQATADAKTGGNGIGVALGQGIAAGITSTKGEINKAAADAVADAVTSGRKEGDIHSPSRKTRAHIGRELGRGVSLGIRDEGNNIQKAAEDAFVPSVDTDGKSTTKAKTMGSSSQRVLNFYNCTFGGVQQEELERVLTIVLDKETQQFGEGELS